LYDTGLSMGDSVLVMAAAGGGGLAAAHGRVGGGKCGV
jgi:hypothetical protein